MASRKYLMLRRRMAELDVDQRWLGNKLERGSCYITDRFLGRRSWGLDEAYLICSLLRIPQSEFTTYFPPGGGETSPLHSERE